MSARPPAIINAIIDALAAFGIDEIPHSSHAATHLADDSRTFGARRRAGVRAQSRVLNMLGRGAVAALALIGALVSSSFAAGARLPSRPIRIVVGYPAGAGVDFTARLFADWLKTAFGQPTIVENRPGAGGEIAAEYVAHAEPDGYTLLYAVGSDLYLDQISDRQPTVDPLKDLTPVATVISSVNCVAVNAPMPSGRSKTWSNSAKIIRASSPTARLEYSRTTT